MTGQLDSVAVEGSDAPRIRSRSACQGAGIVPSQFRTRAIRQVHRLPMQRVEIF
jgi:hypothetical protein